MDDCSFPPPTVGMQTVASINIPTQERGYESPHQLFRLSMNMLSKDKYNQPEKFFSFALNLFAHFGDIQLDEQKM